MLKINTRYEIKELIMDIATKDKIQRTPFENRSLTILKEVIHQIETPDVQNKIFICKCGGTIGYNEKSFYHHCQDCSKVYTDEDINLFLLHGSYEAWEDGE